MLFVIALIGASSFVIPKITRGAPNTWTFMVYMDGDNDLEYMGILDFLEMSASGSNPNVNIVVQFDRSANYDTSYGNWTTCKRFNITNGMTPDVSNAISDIGEVNMGNPNVLSDFIVWGVTTFPAVNYALILWDHGASWRGVAWDYTSSPDYLNMTELGAGLSAAKSLDGGVMLDIISFDACSMASIEVAYEVMPYAKYLVASEKYDSVYGFEYTGPLSALVANPDMTALEFSNEILDHFSNYYLSLSGTPKWDDLNQSFTLSVVDLGLVDELAGAVDALATELRDNLGLWINHIALARNLTEDYDAAWVNDGIDIYHFAENLRNVTPNATIDALAEGVMFAVEASVLNETHGTNPNNFIVPVNHTHGLSMYFYPPAGWRDTSYPVKAGNFTVATVWDELLVLYQAELALGNPTVMDFSPSSSNVPLDADIVVTFSEPMNASSATSSFSILPYVAGSFQFGSNNMTFSPDASGLEPGTTYTVTISVNATDEQGHHLQQDFVWQFTTAAAIPEFPTAILPALLVLGLVLAISRRRLG